MPGKWLLIAVAAFLTGIGIGALSILWQAGPGRSKTPAAEAPATPPSVARITLPAVLRCSNVVRITTPIEGTLVEVFVKVGDEVAEGTLLARIRNTALETEFDTARENLARAEEKQREQESALIAARLEATRANANLSRIRIEFEQLQRTAQRQRLLHSKGATPRLVYEKAQAEFAAKQKQYDVAKKLAGKAEDKVSSLQRSIDAARRVVEDRRLELDEISTDLESTEVLSPVAGIVSAITAGQGEEVSPSMAALFEIAVDLTSMEAWAEASPEQLELIRPRQTADIRVAEASGEILRGIVSAIRDGRIVVEFRNPSPRIRPGLTARVSIHVRSGSGNSAAGAPANSL